MLSRLGPSALRARLRREGVPAAAPRRGLLPRMDKLGSAAADIAAQKQQTREIILSCYPACTEPDPDTPGACPAQVVAG